MKTIILIAFCGLMFAEEVAAPEISAEQQLDYMAAQVEQLQANAHMEAAVASMAKTCGERPIILGDKKRPVCGKKPEK